MADATRQSTQDQPKPADPDRNPDQPGGGEIEWSNLLDRDPSTGKQRKEPPGSTPAGTGRNPATS